MFYFVSLGLRYKHITKEIELILNSVEKIYLEGYTSFWPENDLKEFIKNYNPIILDRRYCEEELDWIKDNVAFCVFGDAFFATTHDSIKEFLRKKKISYKYIPNTSIFNVFSRVGLMYYKIGGVITIPNFECYSWKEKLLNNLKEGKHTLILLDTSPKRALKMLGNLEIVLIQRFCWDDEKIYFDKAINLINKEIKPPVSIIVPGNLHPIEKENLEEFI
jgi:diphthine synthase